MLIPLLKSKFPDQGNGFLKLNRLRSLSFRFVVILVVIFSSVPSARSAVLAQSNDGNWEPPVNLSNSGATQSPVLIKGISGKLHALWQDEYARFVYRFYDDGWSKTYNLDLPFYGFSFKTIVDQTGWIYAFWIDETNNNLYYSGVNENSFGNEANWLGSNLLASSVVAFDVTIDENNDTHLIFTRARETIELPAGIYYSKTRSSISNWSTATQLYTSKYYRSLIAPEGVTGPEVVFNLDLTTVNIATSNINGEIHVFAGWDNPDIKRMYYSLSIDNGSTWDTPIEIVSPSNELINITPKRLKTIVTDEVIMQLWEITEPGGNCSIFYRTSEDQGQQWGYQQTLESVFGQCPDQLSWTRIDNNQILFITGKQNVISLIVWNGNDWSIPQSQDGLNQLINPDTLDLIGFSSYDTLLADNRLFLIGTDNTSSRDIWISQKTLGDVSTWFGGSISWSQIDIQNLEGVTVNDLQGFNGTNNLFHFVWTQPNIATVDQSKLQLLTVSADGTNGISTIRDNLEGIASQLTTAALVDTDRLALLWRGGKFGHLYSAWVFLTQVTNPVGWSQPGQISNTPIGHTPAITQMNDFKLFAVYSVPFSEEWGVFWLISENGGETWSEPQRIDSITSFEDCPQILNPDPLIDNIGNIHVAFICSTYEGGSGALSLNTVQSSDQGKTWSSPTQISGQSTSWIKQFIDSDFKIHRLWKTNDGRTSLWHSFSTDNGVSWSNPENFALIEEFDGATTATIDQDNQLHVFLAIHLDNSNSSINYYRWTGDKWINIQSLDLSAAGEGEVSSIASGIDSSNNLQLGVALTANQYFPVLSKIIHAHYPLNLTTPPDLTDNTVVTALPQETPVIENSSQGTATIAPSPTQTVQLDLLPSQALPTWLGISAGVVLSIIFIVFAFILIKKGK
jgi:hypothetical protein